MLERGENDRFDNVRNAEHNSALRAERLVCKDQVTSVLNEVGVICYAALTDQARILVLRHKLPLAKIEEDLNAMRACGQKLL